MIDTISSQGFLDGVLSSEQSFGLLITRFRSVWIHFLLHAFPQITENKAAKHGSAFGLLKLSAFHLHLRPRNKVALWSVLIQASLDCNFESTQKRRSRSHWKPNWQLVWKEILAAYACRCLQGTRDCGKKDVLPDLWIRLIYIPIQREGIGCANIQCRALLGLCIQFFVVHGYILS